jgi:hypothetical protein
VPTITFSDASPASTDATGTATHTGITFKTITLASGAGGVSAVLATQSLPGYASDWVITTETPSICTVLGNVITRVTPGTGILRFSDPNGISKLVTVAFSNTSTVQYVWTGFSGVTLASQLADPILELLVPGKQKNYFVTNYTAGATTMIKNTTCWAEPLNLTGSAISTSLGGTANSGALITPRHWIGVAHWGSDTNNMGPGAVLRFAGSDGTIHSRNVLRRNYAATADRIVCLLDSDLPASVTPFKFAPANMFDLPASRVYGMGWQITQEKFVTPISFNELLPPPWRKGLHSSANPPVGLSWESSFSDKTDPDHRLFGFDHLIQIGRVGDSGGAIGGYFNGETFIVSLFTSTTSGSVYSEYNAPELNAIIAALDTAQGISTGYTVGIIDFSPSLTFQTNQLTLNGNILTFTN